jgi:hypothetical protein
LASDDGQTVATRWNLSEGFDIVDGPLPVTGVWVTTTGQTAEYGQSSPTIVGDLHAQGGEGNPSFTLSGPDAADFEVAPDQNGNPALWVVADAQYDGDDPASVVVTATDHGQTAQTTFSTAIAGPPVVGISVASNDASANAQDPSATMIGDITVQGGGPLTSLSLSGPDSANFEIAPDQNGNEALWTIGYADFGDETSAQVTVTAADGSSSCSTAVDLPVVAPLTISLTPEAIYQQSMTQADPVVEVAGISLSGWDAQNATLSVHDINNPWSGDYCIQDNSVGQPDLVAWGPSLTEVSALDVSVTATSPNGSATATLDENLGNEPFSVNVDPTAVQLTTNTVDPNGIELATLSATDAQGDLLPAAFSLEPNADLQLQQGQDGTELWLDPGIDLANNPYLAGVINAAVGQQTVSTSIDEPVTVELGVAAGPNNEVFSGSVDPSGIDIGSIFVYGADAANASLSVADNNLSDPDGGDFYIVDNANGGDLWLKPGVDLSQLSDLSATVTATAPGDVPCTAQFVQPLVAAPPISSVWFYSETSSISAGENATQPVLVGAVSVSGGDPTTIVLSETDQPQLFQITPDTWSAGLYNVYWAQGAALPATPGSTYFPTISATCNGQTVSSPSEPWAGIQVLGQSLTIDVASTRAQAQYRQSLSTMVGDTQVQGGDSSTTPSVTDEDSATVPGPTVSAVGASTDWNGYDVASMMVSGPLSQDQYGYSIVNQSDIGPRGTGLFAMNGNELVAPWGMDPTTDQGATVSILTTGNNGFSEIDTFVVNQNDNNGPVKDVIKQAA